MRLAGGAATFEKECFRRGKKTLKKKLGRIETANTVCGHSPATHWNSMWVAQFMGMQ